MKRGLATAAIIFLVIVLFLTSIELVAFDLAFYKREYEKLNIAQSTGMSDEELIRVTEELLNYLRDERDDLVITAVIDGESRPVFNEREIAHMVDVKDLFLGGVNLRIISAVCFAVSLLLLYLLAKKSLWGYLAHSFLWVFGVVLIFRYSPIYSNVQGLYTCLGSISLYIFHQRFMAA